MKPRALLADHHAIVIEGLRRVLERDFEVIGAVADGRALIAAAAALEPDVIITEVSMPLLNGIEAVREIRKANRNVKIVFLTMHRNVTHAVEAFRIGGSAYVLKSCAATEILEAVREAVQGRTYVTPSVDRSFIQMQMERAGRWDDVEPRLTGRQREVLQLIAEGRTMKEIAGILNVSSRTVEFHKYRILRALALRNTTELVQYAIRSGIVYPS